MAQLIFNLSARLPSLGLGTDMRFIPPVGVLWLRTQRRAVWSQEAAQRGCGHPVPGGGQGQVRWGPGQLSWGVAAPPTEWCGTGWASGSLPTQNILWFYDWSALRETLSSGCGQAAQQHLSGQPETLQHWLLA